MNEILFRMLAPLVAKYKAGTVTLDWNVDHLEKGGAHFQVFLMQQPEDSITRKTIASVDVRIEVL